MRSLPVLAVGAVIAAVAAAPAEAADPKKEAKKLIAQGDALFRKGDYEGALAKYQQAYEAFPSPKIFFPMAQAEEKLGRDLEALAHYEQLLAEAGDDLSESVKVEAQARIQEIEKRIVVVSFDIYPNGTTISIDDVEIGTSPLETPTRLMPGAHKFTFAAEGYKTETQEQELAPGDRPTMTIKLKSAAPLVARRPKAGSGGGSGGGGGPVDTGGGGGGGGGKTVLYAGIALTAAFAVGATVTGLMAVQKHGIFTDPMQPTEDREAARDSGETLALTTDLLVAGAIASGVFTAYWYWAHKPARAERRAAPPAAAPSPDEDAPPELDSMVAPWVAPDAGGLALVGRF